MKPSTNATGRTRKILLNGVTCVPEHIEAYLAVRDASRYSGISLPVCRLVEAVEICAQTNQIELALEIIGRILELKPHHEQSLQKRIDLLFSHQRNGEGVGFFARIGPTVSGERQRRYRHSTAAACLPNQPRRFQSTLVLAEAYLTNGQMRKATGLFRQVIPHFLEVQDWE